MKRESNVPSDGFPYICRIAFSSGFAITKRSDTAGVSLACFPSLFILWGARTPAWSGRSLSRSSAMSGDGGVV